MTTYGLFSVDFAVNSLNTFGANKKVYRSKISEKERR